MGRKKTLRLIALAMLAIAVVFVICVLSNPALGSTIYIGPLEFGAEYWRACYAAYVVVMIGLFASSFFAKEKTGSEETMKSKSNLTLIAVIACLAIALVACFMRIGSLEREIDEVRNSYSAEISALRSDMSSIYANVDAQMKRQASILSSVEWSFGDFDPDALTVAFEISAMPKTLSDETRVSVSLAGEAVELVREGDSFSGSVTIPLFVTDDANPVITVANGKEKSTEVIEEADASLVWSDYLPTFHAEDMSGQVELNGGNIEFNTDILVKSMEPYHGTAVFTEAAVVVAVNGSEVDRIDAMPYMSDEHGHPFVPLRNSYPVPDGGEVVVSIFAIDSLGFTHSLEISAYTVGEDDLAFRAPLAASYGEQIWTTSGELAYVNKG